MNGKEKTILVVEDENNLRNVLRDKFDQENFIVLEAKNGKEGLEMALKEHPHMILLDIVMPKMDGMTMLEKLREDKWGQYAKVIILTNLSDAENTLKAIKHGSFDYLVKSDWKLADVVEKAKKLLEE